MGTQFDSIATFKVQLSKDRPSGIIPLKRLMNVKKIRCLVINPGVLARELYDQEKIYNQFHFEYWSSNLNSIDELKLLLTDSNNYYYVLLDSSENDHLSHEVLSIINNFRLKFKRVYTIISFYENITGRIPLLHIKKEWIFNDYLFFVSHRRHLENFKRIFDLAISFLILPFAMIVSSLGMLMIKLTSKGPVMFKQLRVGKDGKSFTIYKLRTMIYNPSGHTTHTLHNDNRIFPVGKFLRKSKIDELPQLLNVIRGDMSLIGPRPEKVDIVKTLSIENPYYSLRHTIRPGITGWAQVNHPKATPEDNLIKLEYDLFYAKNASYFLELRILLKTLKIVLTQDSL